MCEKKESTHSHGHDHEHKHTKAVLNRLSRASGHLESVKRMIENGEDCGEVLIQLSAVTGALNSAGKIILKDHMEHCIAHAVETGDNETIDKFLKTINYLVK
ncbi:MAG: metal-sensing transcriptional repressor [Epulopiscium sp.]|nr:metal-sensing transcriptional repressor [Candidatus Epulonipiscium sp.]